MYSRYGRVVQVPVPGTVLFHKISLQLQNFFVLKNVYIIAGNDIYMYLLFKMYYHDYLKMVPVAILKPVQVERGLKGGHGDAKLTINICVVMYRYLNFSF